MKRLYLCLLLSVSWALASPLPLQARDILNQGSLALVRALISPERPYLDHPLWKEALAFGQMAKQIAPTHPEPYGYLAKVYSHLGWYERAWVNYQSYKTLGGKLSDAQQSQIAELAKTLGYSLLMQGLYAEAKNYLLSGYGYDKDPEIAFHLARAYLGLEQADLAQVYLRQLEARAPGSEYGSYLELAQDQGKYGQLASQAFQQGIRHYYQGNPEAALEGFRQAIDASASYQKAFVWAGRTALELKRPAEALPYWQAAIQLNPQDARAGYFLDLSQNQLRWGSEAYQAFLEGLRFAEQGQVDVSRQAFERAVSYNPAYSDAWAQLGYLAGQQGDSATAKQAFAEAVRLEPHNSSYQQAYQQAMQQLEAETQKVSEAVLHTAPTVMNQAVLPQAMLSIAPEALSLPSERTVSLSLLPYLEPISATGGETLILLNEQHDYAPLSSASQSAITFFSSPDNVRRNLLSPVDYASGTVYQRLEVLSKPSDDLIYYQLCLVPDDDISIKPACSRASGLTLTQEGVYEFTQPLATFYEYYNIDWRRGLNSLMVILRNKDGSVIDAFSGGASDKGNYFPMQVNHRVALVPSGTVFEGW